MRGGETERGSYPRGQRGDRLMDGNLVWNTIGPRVFRGQTNLNFSDGCLPQTLGRPRTLSADIRSDSFPRPQHSAGHEAGPEGPH